MEDRSVVPKIKLLGTKVILSYVTNMPANVLSFWAKALTCEINRSS
jgi:hypothetical protein